MLWLHLITGGVAAAVLLVAVYRPAWLARFTAWENRFWVRHEVLDEDVAKHLDRFENGWIVKACCIVVLTLVLVDLASRLWLSYPTAATTMPPQVNGAPQG